MRNRTIKFIIIIFVLLGSLKICYTQEIQDINIIKKVNGEIISLDIILNKKIPDEIFGYLKNGVKITIVYHVNLFEKKPFYFIVDSAILKKEITISVRYNMWQKVYYVEFDNEHYKFNQLEEVKNKIINLQNVFLINSSQLEKDGKYYCKVKADIESIKLFPPLSWIFDLVTTREFDTSWKEEFIQ